MAGKFFGIGVGPGDPELITVRGRRVLASVPVVAVPISRPGEASLALRAVRPWLSGEQEILELLLPMLRAEAELEAAWERAAGELLKRLRRELDVAFLTLGDGGLYSTYGYLLPRLRRAVPDLEIETVPGVPSFCAAAARFNLALAQGAEPLAVLPSAEDLEELRLLLRTFPNLVLMKVHRRYPEILRVLEEEGRLGEAVFASRCGWPEERLVRDLKEDGVGLEPDYLSLIIVKGEGHR
ncbi:MAG: precorrin-2 C(20)-methyltransferase [Moorellales bacterium]